MTVAPLLLAAGPALAGTLGSLHLLYTFHGNRFDPRDPALRAAMERSHFVITRQTTVWRATRGFHATHSLGLMAFALVYVHLALWRFDVLGASPFLLALGLAVLLSYAVLAWRYFFSIPFRGVVLASALYAAGWALS